MEAVISQTHRESFASGDSPKYSPESRSLLLARDGDSIAARSTHADMAKEDLIQNPATLDSATR